MRTPRRWQQPKPVDVAGLIELLPEHLRNPNIACNQTITIAEVHRSVSDHLAAQGIATTNDLVREIVRATGVEYTLSIRDHLMSDAPGPYVPPKRIA